MLQKPSVILAFLACLYTPIAGAQSTASFPEMPVDSRTARVQNQAEEIYTRGDYKRAFFIYRHELTPIGDKYGQYMVGYMYLTGKGVEQDVAAASAWYRLAAERGTKQFVQERDRLLAGLDRDQRARSDAMFIDVRQKYGDLVLMAQAVRKDYETLKARTGSRLGSNSSPLTIVDANTGTQSGNEYYARIERRMKARIRYIAEHTEISITDLDVDDVDLVLLEQHVTARLRQLP